jgi:hypothetical protein
MSEAAFSLRQDEKVLKESEHNHYLRPGASWAGRLCRVYLTNQRLVLCEAYYDIARKTEKGVGGVLYEAPLSAVERVLPGPFAIEPSLELDVLSAPGGREKVLVCFRDKGWHAGLPQRLAECDDWIQAIVSQRQKPRFSTELLESRSWLQGPRPAELAVELLSPAAPALEAEASLLQGKYELMRQIGSGGMGVVFEGKDRRLDRPVAIKQIRPDIRMYGRVKAMFMQEAKTSAALHHPFIVDIYAVVDQGEEVYLIFEYVDGENLADYLERAGRMPLEKLRPVLKCACEALAYAHSSKVAHRDLKPSNIMLTRQGYAKVMDFGIARRIKDTVSRLTHKEVSGTLPYMAPEQEQGLSDARSDIFSLGVTVYELLAGRLPFAGPDFYAQKERGEFQPLAQAEPELPPEFAAAVDRSLRFEAKARYEDVAAFASALGVS